MKKILALTSALAMTLFVGAGIGVAVNPARDGLAWGQESVSDNPGDQTDWEDSDASQKATPPNVAGSWCGEVLDNLLGGGTIHLQIDQKGRKLHGPWSDSLGGSGSAKGKIEGDTIKSTLKIRTSKCKFAIIGTLVAPGEISGSYSVFGCHQSDGGTFDITNPCTM